MALCALVGYLAISRTIMNRMDHQLEQRATVFTAMPLEMFSPAYLDAARELLASSGYQESLVYADGTAHQPQNLQLQRLGPDGQPGEILATYQVWAPFGPPEIAVAAHQGQTSLRTLNYNGVDYRVYAIHNTYGDGSPDGPRPSALVFSTSLAPTESALNTIATISVVVGLLGIGLAAFAGLAIGRGALRPVVRLSQATEYIARTGDLTHLPVKGDDEIAQLTRNFNTMLEALARSREHQKRLVADAGHELRTPLTSIRTNLDLLAQVAAAPDDARLPAEEQVALLNDVRAQMEELSMLISDLVELSRDEQPAHTIEHLDLVNVVERAVERVQRRAPRIRYDLRLQPWHLQATPPRWNAWSPTCSTTPGSSPRTPARSPSPWPTACSRWPTRARASPRRTSRTSSNASTAPRRRAPRRAPASAWRSCCTSRRSTAAGSRRRGAPGGGALLSVWLPGSPERVG